MKTFNIYYKYRIIRDRYSNKNTSILLDQKNNQPDDSQILRRYLRINGPDCTLDLLEKQFL